MKGIGNEIYKRHRDSEIEGEIGNNKGEIQYIHVLLALACQCICKLVAMLEAKVVLFL